MFLLMLLCLVVCVSVLMSVYLLSGASDARKSFSRALCDWGEPALHHQVSLEGEEDLVSHLHLLIASEILGWLILFLWNLVYILGLQLFSLSLFLSFCLSFSFTVLPNCSATLGKTRYPLTTILWRYIAMWCWSFLFDNVAKYLSWIWGLDLLFWCNAVSVSLCRWYLASYSSCLLLLTLMSCTLRYSLSSANYNRALYHKSYPS